MSAERQNAAYEDLPIGDETGEKSEVESDDGELDIPARERRLVTQPFDFTVGSLMEQLRTGGLRVSDWQRYYVWDDARASRLIESLFLNIPIPVLYFAEEEPGVYDVIDGLQRVKTIERFLTGSLTLRGLEVLTDLNGLKHADLDQKQQRTLTSRAIRCIVITQESHPEIRFDIFERLNTGSVGLNSQELRNCVYRGDLSELLKDLVKHHSWQICVGSNVPDKRMRDLEMVLRFFALYYNLEDYRPPMKSLLNGFMRLRRKLTEDEKETLMSLWGQTVECAAKVFQETAFRRFNPEKRDWDRSMNRALFDAIMLTFSRLKPEQMTPTVISGLKRALKGLCENPEFMQVITYSTGHRSTLVTRLRMWNAEVEKLGLETGLGPLLESMAR